MTSFLESELDRAAAARPQLGKLPLAHRLSRTEYQNAVRDLLALGALPKEMSVDYLLPPDNISSGFDNIADLLFVSPTAMERYLDAARKISRLAVGDPTMPVMVNIHRLDPEHPQDERVDELPFGTRGGLAVRSDFPVDGNYLVKVELAGGPARAAPARDDRRRRAREARRRSADRPPEGGRGRRRRACRRRNALEFPLPLKAGPKLVGVVVRPAHRGARRGHASPAHAQPGHAAGHRQRDDQRSVRRQRRQATHQAAGAFSCASPSGPSEEPACARRILSTLARRAYRRPVDDVRTSRT